MAAAVGDVKRVCLFGRKNSKNSYEINRVVGQAGGCGSKKESLVRI
jgi:hypothetical protein